MQTIKNKDLNLVKSIKEDKPELKSSRHQIDNEDKEQLDYFDNFVKLELGNDNTKLYNQSGNKDNFNFSELWSMINFYQSLKTGQITF